MSINYSDAFTHTITSTYGTQGTQWLTQLPLIVEQCATKWNLTELKPYAHLTYNYVLSGMQQGTPIVLKLRCDHSALAKEVAALSTYAGYGCVKVVAHNSELGAILLGRAIPGEPLTTLFPHDDAQATRIAAELIRTLHQAPMPTMSTFPTLDQLLPQLTDEPRVLVPFLAHARTLRKQLLSTQQKTVFLHADFHHGNILQSSAQWTIIDPEGAIGDPIYDLAVYIRNPLADLIELANTKTLIQNRIADFSALLGYDAQRIYDWTYLQAVTSAYWSIEDGLDATKHVKFLTLLRDIN